MESGFSNFSCLKSFFLTFPLTVPNSNQFMHSTLMLKLGIYRSAFHFRYSTWTSFLTAWVDSHEILILFSSGSWAYGQRKWPDSHHSSDWCTRCVCPCGVHGQRWKSICQSSRLSRRWLKTFGQFTVPAWTLRYFVPKTALTKCFQKIYFLLLSPEFELPVAYLFRIH